MRCDWEILWNTDDLIDFKWKCIISIILQIWVRCNVVWEPHHEHWKLNMFVRSFVRFLLIYGNACSWCELPTDIFLYFHSIHGLCIIMKAMNSNWVVIIYLTAALWFRMIQWARATTRMDDELTMFRNMLNVSIPYSIH